jgi:D-aspartate ligase
MIQNQIVIVFAIEHYNPLGVIRTLGKRGIRPDYIAEKGRVRLSSKSKYLNKLHEVDNVEEGYEVLLREYGKVYESGKKPIIICSDDKTIGHLDNHYDELKDKFIFFNAGQQGRIIDYMDKFRILELAKKHGLNILDSRVVKRGDIPADLKYPIITKSISPNSGGWKSDVFICENSVELNEAFKKIKSEEVLLQQFVEKKNEYAVEGCSVNHGKDTLLSIYSTYNYLIKGYYSPYRTSGSFHNPEIEKGLKGMIEEIGFEGIFDAEFLIGPDDQYYFLEVNFRNTTWSYASDVLGMPLAYIWVKSIMEGTKVADAFKPNQGPILCMVEPIDYNLRCKQRGFSKIKWFGELLKSKCKDYWNWHDLKPSLLTLKNWNKLG